jgi:hypothetical protein
MQNEQKFGCQMTVAAAVEDQEQPLPPAPKPSDTVVSVSTVDKRLMNVDEIVEFINSGDTHKAEKASRKAAKRARQKQRKVNTVVVILYDTRCFVEIVEALFRWMS